MIWTTNGLNRTNILVLIYLFLQTERKAMGNELKDILHQEDCACVIKNQQVRRFYKRGIFDLYGVYAQERSFLQGAEVADHVVGKAAAALLVAGGAKQVYADLISLSALMLLRNAGIPTEYGQVVSYIQNHHQNDWCPMESECYGEKSVADMLPLIQRFVEKQKEK